MTQGMVIACGASARGIEAISTIETRDLPGNSQGRSHHKQDKRFFEKHGLIFAASMDGIEYFKHTGIGQTFPDSTASSGNQTTGTVNRLTCQKREIHWKKILSSFG